MSIWGPPQGWVAPVSGARWLRQQARASQWLAKLGCPCRPRPSRFPEPGYPREAHLKRQGVAPPRQRCGHRILPGREIAPRARGGNARDGQSSEGQSIRKHDGISLELRLRADASACRGHQSLPAVTCCVQRVTERAGRRTMSLSQELSCWESNHHGDSGTSRRPGRPTLQSGHGAATRHHRGRRRDCGLRHRLRAGAARRVGPGRRRADGRAWERRRRLPAFSRPTSKVVSSPEFLNLLVRSLSLFDDFIARAQADSGMPCPVPAHRHTSGGRHRRRDARAQRTPRPGSTRRASSSVCSTRKPFGPKNRSSVRTSSALSSCRRTDSWPSGELIRALAGAARRHGAQVIEGSRVRRIAPAGRRSGRRNRSRAADRIGSRAGCGQLVRTDRDRRAARAACRCVPSAVSFCGCRGKGRRFAAWYGAIAAIWCRGTTVRCSSARRWRMRDSTSERRLPACGI